MTRQAICPAEQINPLNFNKMKNTRTTTAQKVNLFLKVSAVVIGVKALIFLIAAIYTAFTNLL